MNIRSVLIALTLVLMPALASASTVDGFGSDIPLSFAVRQIVPMKYRVELASSVDGTKKVSWKGKGEWRQILSRLALENDLKVNVTHTTVRISPLHPEQTSGLNNQGGGFILVPYKKPDVAMTVASAGAAADSVATGAPVKLDPKTLKSSDMAPVTSPGDMAPVASSGDNVDPGTAYPASDRTHDIWIVAQGGDLEDTLYDWAKRAGWSLVWRSDYEYPIEAHASFEGDFIKVSTDLFKSMKATPALYPTFYEGNHVLVVSNAKDDTR